MPRIRPRKILGAMLSPSTSLSDRVLSGGFWISGLKGVQALLNIIRLLILARVLSPNDFGVMGIALLTMVALEAFSQTGFQAALIQKKGNVYEYLNSAWTVLIIRAISIFAVLFLSAPYVGAFFNSEDAEPVIQIIGISALLAGFSNIGVVLFKKNLDFRKESIYQLSGTLADFMVAISSALVFQNVWALVFGYLAGNATRFVLSYVLQPFRPKFNLDLSKISEMWGFGRWIAGSGMIFFAINQGVDAFIGKLLGAVSLGLYQLAYQISSLPSMLLTSTVSEVMFPAYSKLQSDIGRLSGAYLRTLEVTSLLVFPISGLILVSAHDFTIIILGEKWNGIIEPMKILALCGLLSALAGLNSSVLQAVRRPDVITKLTFVKLAIIVILIYPVTMEWNLSGAAFVVLLSSILITPNAYYIVVRRILDCPAISLLKCIVLPLIGTAVASITTAALLNLDTSLFVLTASVTIGIATYVGITMLLERATGLRAWRNITEVMRVLSS